MSYRCSSMLARTQLQPDIAEHHFQRLIMRIFMRNARRLLCTAHSSGMTSVSTMSAGSWGPTHRSAVTMTMERTAVTDLTALAAFSSPHLATLDGLTARVAATEYSCCVFWQVATATGPEAAQLARQPTSPAGITSRQAAEASRSGLRRAAYDRGHTSSAGQLLPVCDNLRRR